MFPSLAQLKLYLWHLANRTLTPLVFLSWVTLQAALLVPLFPPTSQHCPETKPLVLSSSLSTPIPLAIWPRLRAIYIIYKPQTLKLVSLAQTSLPNPITASLTAYSTSPAGYQNDISNSVRPKWTLPPRNLLFIYSLLSSGDRNYILPTAHTQKSK